MLFSYENVYLLYIYFCRSPNGQPSLSGKRILAEKKGQVPLFPAIYGLGLFLLQLGFG